MDWFVTRGRGLRRGFTGPPWTGGRRERRAHRSSTGRLVPRGWGAELVREREGGWAAVRSSSIRVREGDGRWRAEQRQPTGRAVAARTLSDEGDDPGLTDRVGPPVSEREATGRIGQAEKAGLTDRVDPPSSEREATAKSDK
jgi:hypothetical protein